VKLGFCIYYLAVYELERESESYRSQTEWIQYRDNFSSISVANVNSLYIYEDKF
jgi:hypothetical protein